MESDQRMVSRMKSLVKEGLRSVGPSPEISLQLAQTRTDLDGLTAEVSKLSEAVGRSLQLESAKPEIVQFLSAEAARLGELLAGLLDRVHAQQDQLDRLERALERFGGAILEGSAVERRLALIEDRLSLDADERR